MDVSKAQKREEGIRQEVETIGLPLPTPLFLLHMQTASVSWAWKLDLLGPACKHR